VVSYLLAYFTVILIQLLIIPKCLGFSYTSMCILQPIAYFPFFRQPWFCLFGFCCLCASIILYSVLKLFVFQSVKLKCLNPNFSLLFDIINKFYTVSFSGFLHCCTRTESFQNFNSSGNYF
jgi:hypothetical protein